MLAIITVGTGSWEQIECSIIREMGMNISSPVYFWDLGSGNSRLYSSKRGLIADTPTVMLRHALTKKVFYTGRDALALAEKVPPQLEAVWPIRRGHIADPMLTVLIEAMMEDSPLDLMSKILKPTAVVVVPLGFDPVHNDALEQTFARVGFGAVIKIPQAAAIAISSNRDSLKRGALIWDTGHGKTDLTVLSGGNVFLGRPIWRGGLDLDAAIVQSLAVKMHFLISLADAAELKQNYSFATRKDKDIYVLGKDTRLNKIKDLTLSPNDIEEVIKDFFELLLVSCRSFLVSLPSSLLRIIKEDGIVVTGGMSQMEGLHDWLSQALQMPVKGIARQHIVPLLGASKAWEQWETNSYLAL